MKFEEDFENVKNNYDQQKKKSLTPATDEGKLWKYSHCNVRSRDERRTSFVEGTIGTNLIWCQTSNHSSQTTRLSESDTSQHFLILWHIRLFDDWINWTSSYWNCIEFKNNANSRAGSVTWELTFIYLFHKKVFHIATLSFMPLRQSSGYWYKEKWNHNSCFEIN